MYRLSLAAWGQMAQGQGLAEGLWMGLRDAAQRRSGPEREQEMGLGPEVGLAEERRRDGFLWR